jgi:D-alanine-D-alanine ligase
VTEVVRLRIAVLSGGRSSEHEISLASGLSVAAALDPEKYDVVGVTIERDGSWQLEAPAAEGERLALDPGSNSRSVIPRAGGTLSQARAVGQIDVVIPMLHGPYGEDGTLQGMLEMLGVPYVGSGVLASALTMDKAMVKVVLNANGILTARSIALEAHTVLDMDVEAMLTAAEITLPCFVKPARLGSSVGISKVTDIDGLAPALELAFQHDSKVLVEAMVHGMEIECGVLGAHDPMASVPGRLHVNADWYDYAAKYEPGGMDLEAPADIDPELAEEVQRVALDSFRACGCEGMARIDMFVTDGGDVVVNEINTIPGFTETSVYAKLFDASGVSYPQLLDRLIELALDRHREQTRLRH